MPASAFRLCLVPLLAALCADARAQEPLAPEPTSGLGVGTRLRLRTGAGLRFTGHLAASDDSSVTLMDKQGMSIRLGRDQIDGLEVAVPRSRTQGALRGAARGAVAMAVLGGVLYAVDRQTKRADGLCGDLDIGITTCTTGSDVVMGALGGAALGAAFGALLPGDRWQPLRPGMVRVGVGRARGGGVAVGATLSF